jgi:hypothetical protein
MIIDKPKVSNNSTQVVIATDQKFILAKNVNTFTDIISPFKKIKDNFSSKFVLPSSQLHRIQTLYDSMSSISQYLVIDNTIKFDCVSNLPNDIFGNSTEGYIHFSTIKQFKKDKTEIIVDPKIVFQLNDYEVEIFNFNQKIKFKSDFLKAFPIILKTGFMFLTVNKTTCQLIISVTNPKKLLIGECSKYEIINVIQYILPLWSIFDINIGKTNQIKFQPEFFQNRYSDDSPILISISYDLATPEQISIAKIAQNVQFV